MTWLFIGDSITLGMASHLTALFLSFGQVATIDAHVGWSTTSWISEHRVQHVIEENDPDFVVFLLGTNDESSKEIFQDHIRQLMKDAPNAIGIFFVSPFGPDDEERSEWIREQVGNENYVDGLSLVRDIHHYRDNIHMSDSGYRELSEKLAPLIQDRAMECYIE